MADLPVGAAFGTLVHAVFETADLTAADLRAELLRCVHAELARHPAPAVDPDALADALVPVARTPLGPLAAGRSLTDLAPSDRLAELDFELPLAGGDTPGADVRLATSSRCCAATCQPAIRSRPTRTGSHRLQAQPLRGYLTGSIDAVLRLPGPERYAVVDYKTNWLGRSADGPEPLTAAHYTPERIAAAMMDAHYPLQALLYSVALHRFLRWRQPGLRPGAPPRRRALPVPARDVRAGRARWSTACRAGSSPGGRPPRSSTELSDLLDRGAP